MLSGERWANKAIGTPTTIRAIPAINAPQRQPQVCTEKASRGVINTPPTPMELLMSVMAKARRRINQELAKTIGECINPAENAREITPRYTTRNPV